MFIHDKTYDIDELAKYNTHIHTHFSRCAKPEMIVADIASPTTRTTCWRTSRRATGS